MADVFSVTVESTRQGNFTGSTSHQRWVETSSLSQGVSKAGGSGPGNFTGSSSNMGWMYISSFSYVAPRDVNTGQPSGKRQHPPVIITKEVDAASPKFLQALVTKEVLRSVKIKWSRGGNGRHSPRYTTELTHALITNIRRVALPGAKGPGEQVEFSYGKMETKIDLSR